MNVKYEIDLDLVDKNFCPEMVDNETRKRFDVYEKHIVFRQNADDDTKKQCIYMLYDNFISSQIKIGRKLNSIKWWGKPTENGEERIGWLALCEKKPLYNPTGSDTKNSPLYVM